MERFYNTVRNEYIHQIYKITLNNSKAGGIDQAENGFFMIFKAGDRIYIANEGVVGKKFVEDEQ